MKYIPYKLSYKVIDWKDFWFYVENQTPALPDRILGPPTPKASWNPKGQNLAQINDLIGKIEHLKKKGLTGTSVMMNWIYRRIQPLQHRANFGFLYAGDDDPGHLTIDKITEADALHRVCRVLEEYSRSQNL